MFEKEKLHPIFLVTALIESIRTHIIAVAILFFTFMRDGELNSPFFLLFIVLIPMVAVFKYFTFSFQISDDGIRVKSGVFVKKNIMIPYDRIQTMQQKQWFFYRPFHVVHLVIETAGGSVFPEVDLPAVSMETVRQIEAFHAKVGGVNDAEEPLVSNQERCDQAASTVVLSSKEQMILATTSSGIFTVFVLCIGAAFQLPDSLLDRVFDQYFNRIGDIVFLAGIVLFILWAISIIRTFILYHQFKVSKFDDKIVVEKGLFQRQVITLNYDRIQAVTIVSSPIRRLFGYVSVEVAAVTNTSEADIQGKVILLPIIRKNDVLPTLAWLLEQFDFDHRPLYKAPGASAKFFMIPGILCTLPVVAIAFFFFQGVGLWSMILVILAALNGYVDYRATGFHYSSDTLTLQTGSIFSIRTVILLRKRVQSVQKRQSVMTLPSALSHYHVAVLSKKFRVRYIEDAEANLLFNWLKQG